MRSKKNDIKIRSSYDFLEPTDEMPECVPVPKELGKKFKAEVEAVRLARQNRPKFRVTDNLFSGGGGGVSGRNPKRSVKECEVTTNQKCIDSSNL